MTMTDPLLSPLTRLDTYTARIGRRAPAYVLAYTPHLDRQHTLFTETTFERFAERVAAVLRARDRERHRLAQGRAA